MELTMWRQREAKREEDPHPVSLVVANSILVLDLLELNNTVGKIDYTYVVCMYQISLVEANMRSIGNQTDLLHRSLGDLLLLLQNPETRSRWKGQVEVPARTKNFEENPIPSVSPHLLAYLHFPIPLELTFSDP